MSKTNVNASNASKKEIASPAIVDLSKFNLEKFADQLEKISLKEKKNKETIYVYPPEFKKEDLGGEIGKKWRNAQRRKLESMTNNILFFAKGKKMDDLQDAIKKFRAFYKETYRRNDLSIDSLSQSRNDARNAGISLALDIIKSAK